MLLKRKILAASLFATLWQLIGVSFAQIKTDSSQFTLQQDAENLLRGKIIRIINRYCPEACELLNIEVQTAELPTNNFDLGFESISPEQGKQFYVKDLKAFIQIDERITNENRENLTGLLQASALEYSVPLQIMWHGIKLPKIGELIKSDERLASTLSAQINEKIQSIIGKHCPHLCVISDINVDATPISADEAQYIDRKQIFQQPGIDGIIRIDSIDIELSIDNRFPLESRDRIINLLQATLRNVHPVHIRSTLSDFPNTYTEELEKRRQAEDDPFNLKRLRETLEIFRDLAGTKEIITTLTNNSLEKSSESSEMNSSNTTADSKNILASESKSSSDQILSNPWVIAGIASFFLVLVIFILMKFNQAQKNAQAMLEATSSYHQNPSSPAREEMKNESQGDRKSSEIISTRIRIAELKDELTGTFINAPKVAKATYGRILQDEGVEQTSKYIHIFGHTVIFELLDDPNYQRDLAELSEYYHNTNFNLSPEEQLDLLKSLRTKVTATEIKILSQKTMEKFDFLLKLDSNQIYDLIRSEKSAVQCIVLTQLDHRHRRVVFEMFQGKPRIDLMQELCRADAIPKDYLFSVANALYRKITNSASYDTANLRSSEILYDLLERSPVQEQRALMQNLMETNPEASRGIKMKLITIETLMFLKDGHLLDIILNIDRHELLTFLKASPGHIQSMIFSKVPEELAMTWEEELSNIAGIDDKTYRMVEMKIINKIRNLSSTGSINILEINEILFGGPMESEVKTLENLQISRANLVA